MTQAGHLPKKRLVGDGLSFETERILREHRINTVCSAARCPNLNECYSKGAATFLILGDTCTRDCGFCAVKTESRRGLNPAYFPPKAVQPDPQEPWRIAEAVKRLGLKYAVITSVTRDDLDDGGAGHFVKVIEAIRKQSVFTPQNRKMPQRRKDIRIEILVPDFKGDRRAVERVLKAGPDVIGHDIETVRRLYPIARRGASYDISLGLFKTVKAMRPSMLTKSALLTGLGESDEEVIETMSDLKSGGCDILMIGQYLRPGKVNLPVARYLRPEEFAEYRRIGEGMGFRHVSSGPFVRSSYRAEEIYDRR